MNIFRLPNRPTIVGFFVPINGSTLDQVAASCGYDHFNWIQFAIEFPFSEECLDLKLPWYDPPFGGLWNRRCNIGGPVLLDPADHLPFYWDEQEDPAIDEGQYLRSHVSPDRTTLDYIDSPTHFLPLSVLNLKMTFRTFLVGVYPDGSPGRRLYHFMFSSNYSVYGGGILPRRTDIPTDEKLADSTGGIIDLKANLPMEAISLAEARMLMALGIPDVQLDTVDGDQDGVPDLNDSCPGSDLRPTVVIGECDTGVPNLLFANGCSIADSIRAIQEVAPSHGQFVEDVAHLCNELAKSKHIEESSKAAIIRCAAKENRAKR